MDFFSYCCTALSYSLEVVASFDVFKLVVRAGLVFHNINFLVGVAKDNSLRGKRNTRMGNQKFMNCDPITRAHFNRSYCRLFLLHKNLKKMVIGHVQMPKQHSTLLPSYTVQEGPYLAGAPTTNH